GDPPIDWQGLAGNDATIAIYMPGQNLGTIQAELLSGGITAETPVAIVSRASSPAQRTFHTTLVKLHEARHLEAPTILLIVRALGGSANRSTVAEDSIIRSAEKALSDGLIGNDNSIENFERSVTS